MYQKLQKTKSYEIEKDVKIIEVDNDFEGFENEF